MGAISVGDGLRLNIDDAAAFIPALHGGGEVTPEIYVRIGIADAAELEPGAGDAATRVTHTRYPARLEMCARRRTALGADEAQQRHSHRYDKCEELHRSRK